MTPQAKMTEMIQMQHISHLAEAKGVIFGDLNLSVRVHLLHVYRVVVFLLTGGEAASKEHVEEVLRSDVGLKSPVEVEPSSLCVGRRARLLPSRQVVLPSFVCVAQHCIRVTDLWKKTQFSILFQTLNNRSVINERNYF